MHKRVSYTDMRLFYCHGWRWYDTEPHSLKSVVTSMYMCIKDGLIKEERYGPAAEYLSKRLHKYMYVILHFVR